MLPIHTVQMRPWRSTLQRWIRLMTPGIDLHSLQGGVHITHLFIFVALKYRWISDPQSGLDAGTFSPLELYCWSVTSPLMKPFATF